MLHRVVDPILKIVKLWLQSIAIWTKIFNCSLLKTVTLVAWFTSIPLLPESSVPT
jgi:hypothetical protein